MKRAELKERRGIDMKKIFGIGVVSLVSMFRLEAADLRLEAAALGGTTSGQLQVSLTSAAEIVTGLQFDLEYDASRFEVEVFRGRSAELAEKTVRTAAPQMNRMRVLIVGMNQSVITNGVVALIRATPIGSESSRVKNPVRIVAMAATDRAGNPVEVVSRNAADPSNSDATK
jgi:hypothetical protein